MKKTTLRGEEAVAAAKETAKKYLQKHVRPFTAVQVWENTKKSVPKAAMLQAMTDLVSEGSCKSKTFGKTLVYYPVTTETVISTEEICEMLDEEAPELDAKYNKLMREIAHTEQKASSLAREPTNADLAKLALGSETSSLDAARVAVLERQVFVEPETYASALQDHDAQLRRWKQLKKVAMDVIGIFNDRDDDIDIAHLAGILDDEEAAAISSRRLP